MCRKSILSLLVAATALALGGCQQLDDPADMAYEPNSTKELYPLSVEKGTLSLNVPTNAASLTPDMEADLMRVGYSASISKHPKVVVSRSRNGKYGKDISVAVAQALVRGGLAQRSIIYVSHDGPGVMVSYTRIFASAKECGGWNDMTVTGKNKLYQNFGCAASANLAALVADPDDLVIPRRMTPPDSMRRDQVITDYRIPQDTSTPPAQSDDNNIATIGNN